MESILSIASLRLVVGQDDTSIINLLGYYGPNDGGGGLFAWDSSSTESDNSGTTIKPSIFTTEPGRWKRQISNSINVKWFGAKADTITDAKAAFEAAFNYVPTNGVIYVPNGTYLVENAYFPSGKTIYMQGDNPTIICDTATTCFTRESHDFTKIDGFIFTTCDVGLRFETPTTSEGQLLNYEISNCQFIDCTYAGVVLIKCREGNISHSYFKNCGYGIYYELSVNCNVNSSFFNSCGKGFFANGLGSAYSASPMLGNCTFIACNIGFHIIQCDNFHVSACIIDYNDQGVKIEGQDGGCIEGSYISSRTTLPALEIISTSSIYSTKIKIINNSILTYDATSGGSSSPVNCIEIEGISDCLFSGNDIIFYSKYGVEFKTGNTVFNTIFENNNFSRRNPSSGAIQPYAIGIPTGVTADNSNYFNTNIFNNSSYVFYITTSFNFTLLNNRGYKTRNKGTSVITSGTSVTVNHGLPDINFYTLITPSEFCSWRVTNKTSSTFTIEISSASSVSISFDWEAIYLFDQ